MVEVETGMGATTMLEEDGEDVGVKIIVIKSNPRRMEKNHVKCVTC
jgi:hypothetical protein